MPKEIHSCRNCGNQFEGRYCNRCGEKVFHEQEKYVPHLLEDAFHFTTHFEGKFFNTLRAVVTSPGKLSFDYSNGLRKKYFKPISFFLMLVILYLVFPFFEGLNMKLHFHVNHEIYGDWAMKKTQEVMEARGWSQEEISKAFVQKGEKTSKFLLFLMIPFIALVSWMLAFRNRKLYFDHFVISIEMCSFLILWGFLVLPLIVAIAIYFTGSWIVKSEWQIGLLILGGCLVYNWFASRRFFGFSWLYAVIYAMMILFFTAVFVQYIYKFILFAITISLL